MSSGEPSRRMPRSLAASVGLLLRSRHLPVIAAALAVLLALPSLGVGWILDDDFHRTILLERSRLRDLLGGPSEMFRFFRGDPERTGRLMDIGLFPWWTDPGLKGEFLQALTVLTHRLDYALWPDSAATMHAHSLFWLGAVAAVTAAFYRRMLGATRVAGVGTVNEPDAILSSRTSKRVSRRYTRFWPSVSRFAVFPRRSTSASVSSTAPDGSIAPRRSAGTLERACISR